MNSDPLNSPNRPNEYEPFLPYPLRVVLVVLTVAVLAAIGVHLATRALSQPQAAPFVHPFAAEPIYTPSAPQYLRPGSLRQRDFCSNLRGVQSTLPLGSVVIAGRCRKAQDPVALPYTP